MHETSPSTWIKIYGLSETDYAEIEKIKTPKDLQSARDSKDNSKINDMLLSRLSKFGAIWKASQLNSGSQIDSDVQEVFSIKEFDTSSNYFSSTFPLSFHQDWFFETSPPSLSLIWCVRNKEMAATKLVNLNEALFSMRKEYRNELGYSNFLIGNYDKDTEWQESSIYDDKTGTFRYDEDLIRPLNNAAAEALNCFVEAVHSKSHSVVIHENELLIVNNRTCAHARSSYTPLSDEKRRWLKRCLIA